MGKIGCILICVLAGLLYSCGLPDNLSSKSSEELFDKGREYLLSKDMPDSSLICFSTVANRYNPDYSVEQKRLCSKACNNLGYLYYHYFNDIPHAYEALSMAKLLSEETSDSLVYGQVCINLAILNQLCRQLGLANGMNDNSVRFYSDAFDVALRYHDWPTLLNSFANMTTVAFSDDCPETFKDRIIKFGEIALPDSIPGKQFYIDRYNTAISVINKDYKSALEHINRQLNSLNEVYDRPHVKTQVYNELVHVYENMGYPDSARYYNQNAIDLAQSTENLYQEAILYKEKDRILKQQHKPLDADLAKLQFYELKDSLMAAHDLMMIENLSFIADVKRYNHIYAYTYDKQAKRLMIAIFISLLLIITIPMIVALYRRNRKLKESYAQLYDKQREILRQWDEVRTLHAKPVMQEIPIRHRTLNVDNADLIKNKVLAIMDSTDEIYSSEFSLDRLAELASVKPRVLSSVLNDTLNKSFYTLLNEYRVREACRRLEDEERYGHLTIEAISQSLGYKSRTTLVNVFKKQIGLTPTEYQRISRQKSAGN